MTQRLVITVLLCVSCMIGQTSNYPAGLDTIFSLGDLADRAQSTLTGSMTSTATSFTVLSGAKFTAGMILSIENEQIKVWSVVGNTINVGNSSLNNVDGRGFAGTANVSHANLLLVSNYVVAWQLKAIRNAVIAVQTTLGVNLSNITVPNPTQIDHGGTGAQTAAAARTALGAAASGANADITSLTGLSTPLPVPEGGSGATILSGILQGNGTTPMTAIVGAEGQYLRRKPNAGATPVYEFASPASISSSVYNFPAQTPGGTLSAGANAIPLAPCPQGVNGSDVSHWLYITGGVGTAEAVLITGGTCTSGAASGTIIATAAGAHSGAWTIGSDSGGIREALIAGGTKIDVPTGTYDIHAEIFVGASATITCAEKTRTIIRTNSLTQNAFHINGAGSVKIDNCTIATAVVKTAGAGVYVDGGNGGSMITNSNLIAPYNCFDFEAAILFSVTENYCASAVANGLINHYTAFADSGDSKVIHNTFDAGLGGSGAGILYGSGGGMRVLSNKILGFAYSIDLSLDNGATTSIFLVEANSMENTATGGIRIRRLGTGSLSLINILGNQMSMPANPINVGAGFPGVNVSGNILNFGTGTGILLASANNMVANNILFGGTVGIDVSASTLATTLVNNQINGAGTNWIGNAITSSANPSDLFAFANLPTAAASGSTGSCVNCTIGSNPCTVGASITPIYRSGVAWRCP